MINKVYEKVKEYIKENIWFFLSLIIISLLSIIKLPVYIEAPGGLVNLDNKIIIKDKYDSSGGFYMAYVTNYKPNLLMCLYAFISPDIDIYKQEEILMDNESAKSLEYRQKMDLASSVDMATILAYTKANKQINITKQNLFVTYIFNEAKTTLEVGDQIISIDGVSIGSKEQINEIINQKKLNEKLELEVINDGKKTIKYATKTKILEEEIIGIIINTDYEYEINPSIDFKLKKNESGPSGGLMMSLKIYNDLTNVDLSKGYKIAGTGTISKNGEVGQIGGVKYKLRGAIKNKADIFLVPAGENYEEAIKEKEKHNYNIKIVSVSTFDEAVEYLKKL